MNGGIRHHIIQDRKSRMKESRFKRIALKFLVAYLIYFLISHILFEDALPRRSLSPCKKKKSAIPRRLSDYYGQMVNEKEIVNKRGDSSLTNLYNRVRYLIADDEDECELIYPQEVVKETGTNSYYAPTDIDSGFYYEDQNEEIPLAEVEEITNEAGEVDPSILVPDINEPMYYSEVDTTLLGLFEPQVYEPVNETNRPEGTTAYTVTITSCPGTYNPPASEVSDPGADIYEASAICKNNVCNNTDDTITTARRNLQGQRDLELATAPSETDYTM